MLHVFFINTRYVPEGVGGPAFSVQFLAEQIVREGDRATVFCRGGRPGITRETMEGVKVVRIGSDAGPAAVASALRTALNYFRPDILHTNYLRDLPIGALTTEIRGRKLTTIHTLREFSFASPTQEHRALAAEVAGLVGISRFMLEFHERSGVFSQAKVKRVIHNSYEPPPNVEPVRSATPVPKNTPLRLGYLGRLDAEKGVEYLLKVLLGEMRDESWTLTVAGKGAPDYEGRLRKQFVDRRVRFLGFSRPTDLFSQVDILVVPSLWEEPLARVPIEAYAHGVPVVVSNKGGLPELVEPGVTGLVFDPTRQGALSAALKTLISDRAKVASMRDPARAKWHQQFTPAAILREYRELYADVTSEASSA